MNRVDTFKIVFPEEEEFLEINFCVDTFANMRQLIDSLSKSQDFVNKVANNPSLTLYSCERPPLLLLP